MLDKDIKTMYALVVHSPGDANVLRWEQRPVPIPNKGEVLIHVKAFGLNRSELMTRKGYSPNVRFPRILGIECVGEVVSDPSMVFKAGEKVAAFMKGMGRDYDGSYAEYVVLPHTVVTVFKSHLPWEILGALPEMFQTAHGSLHHALHVHSGERILIRGGTSSVGLLAAQIAKRNGLYVISTTRNPAKRSLLLESGSDEVWLDNGKLQGTTAESGPVDKVLELVGTTTLKDSLRCVRQGGIVCMTDMLSEKWGFENFEPKEAIPASVYLTCYDSGQIRVGGKHFQEFLQQIEQGEITPMIKRTFKLKELPDAHRLMEENTGGGKIVIVTY